MLDIWNGFDALQKVLLCMAVPATLALLVELIAMLVGLAQGAGDLDVDGPDVDGLDIDSDGLDMDADGPDAALDAGARMDAQEGSPARGELRWFTLVGLLSFFAIAGWSGLALIEASLPGGMAVVLALGMGVLAMYLCAVVLRWFGRLSAAGNMAIGGAVGQFAEAYVPIEPQRRDGGKVSLVLQGRFLVLDAVTDSASAIPTGTRVVITGLADDSTVLVRPAREQGD